MINDPKSTFFCLIILNIWVFFHHLFFEFRFLIFGLWRIINQVWFIWRGRGEGDYLFHISSPWYLKSHLEGRLLVNVVQTNHPFVLSKLFIKPSSQSLGAMTIMHWAGLKDRWIRLGNPSFFQSNLVIGGTSSSFKYIFRFRKKSERRNDAKLREDPGPQPQPRPQGRNQVVRRKRKAPALTGPTTNEGEKFILKLFSINNYKILWKKSDFSS